MNFFSNPLQILCLVLVDAKGKVGEGREGGSVLGAQDGGENEVDEDDGGDALPPGHAEIDEATS